MRLLILSVLIAFITSIAMGPIVIPMLKRLKFGQQVRDDGPKTHLSKAGTPTMGGVMIIVAIAIAVAALTRGSVTYVLAASLVVIVYGFVGFLDDFIKIKLKRSLGLKAYQKIIAQVGIAIVIAVFAYNDPDIGSVIVVPFFNVEWDLGLFYIPFIVFVIISTVNAVNLTDGLDGLASGVTLIYALAMAIVYMALTSVAESGGQVLLASNYEGMVIFCGAIVGACLGFLRFNAYPARVFMGDTGSLALGGAVAMMAIMNRGVLLIPIMGACYVASIGSSLIQIVSYKTRKKRVFKMAPLHHHFELKGYPETKVVAMYMIVTALLCMAALLSFV
jgi:phospho-N-acetylmuramoyl-pentapeptide-transferase